MYVLYLACYSIQLTIHTYVTLTTQYYYNYMYMYI